MEDCVFCKIVAGEIPSQVVHEDERTLAFLNIEPVIEGHVLVIPKTHSEEFPVMDQADYQAVMATVKDIADTIKKLYRPRRVGLLAYGFDVAHTHIHVLPIMSGEEIKHGKGRRVDQNELSAVKDKFTNQ